MNWGELIDRTLLGFPDKGLRPTVTKYLMEAQEDFILRTGCLTKHRAIHVQYPLGDYLNPTPPLPTYVNLPADFIRVLRIEWNGQKLLPMTKQYMKSCMLADETFKFGVPTHYYSVGRKLHLYPAPASADSVNIWYVYRPMASIGEEGYWGEPIMIEGGYEMDHCPVRPGVIAQIFIDDEDHGGEEGYTFIRCFDVTQDIPIPGNEYHLDSFDLPPAWVKDWLDSYSQAIMTWEAANLPYWSEAIIFQLEPNRLCAFYADFTDNDDDDTESLGVRIIHINPDTLDVLSVGEWIPVNTGNYGGYNLRGKCIRDNQAVVSWQEWSGMPTNKTTVRAMAITFDGDEIDSQSTEQTLPPARVNADSHGLATKRDGTFLYLSADHGTNVGEVGKYTVGVDNSFTYNYNVEQDLGAGTGADVMKLEYDAVNDFYVGSTVSTTLKVWTATDTGSAINISAIDTWATMRYYGGVGVLQDGTALAFGRNSSNYYVYSDWISYSGAVPSLAGDQYSHYEDEQHGFFFVQDVGFIDAEGGRPFLSIGLGDNYCSVEDANWSRLWIAGEGETVDPAIDVIYRKYLVDYAKQLLYEDRGDIKRATMKGNQYKKSTDFIAEHFSRKLNAEFGVVNG